MNDISQALPAMPASTMTEADFDSFIETRTRELLRASRLADFKRSCPAEFCLPIDRARIPNIAAWDVADSWACSSPGLWLWSHETGRAKSRMAWRLLGRAYCNHGKRYFATTGMHLAEIYFGYHMAGEPASFYSMVFRNDLVLVDDIDKCDVADKRTGPMLREFFDEAYKRRAAVVVTANEPISYFEQVIGSSAARRLREVCTEIQF